MINFKINRSLASVVVFLFVSTVFSIVAVEAHPQMWKEKIHGIDLKRRGSSRVIVRFAEGVDESTGVSLVGARKTRRLLRVVPAVVADLTVSEVESLAGRDEVAYIEPDYRVYALEESLPWGVDRIDADLVHPYFTGRGVRVAILDTGIDYHHPDLDDNYKGGHDFVNFDDDPMDDHYHGTVVAGIVAAEMNGLGVVGVAPEAHLYGVKVLDRRGQGFVSSVVAGIDWAIDNNMQIISMSLGGARSHAMQEACQGGYDAGLLLVAAAGNSGPARGRSTVGYPAAYDTVIAVSATQEDDELAWFSSTGPEVEIAAPGVDIFSTAPDSQYRYMSGTSSACPHVTGVAALLFSAYPMLTNGEVRELLGQYAEDLGPVGGDDMYGCGIVDAYAALFGDGDTNEPPMADAGGPYSGAVGAPVSFDASASYDPENLPLSYQWDFGDGQTGEGVQTTHIYTGEGVYEVTLTVVDPLGLADSGTTTARIVRGRQESITVFPEEGYVGYVYGARPDSNRFDSPHILVGVWGSNIFYGAVQFMLPEIPGSAFLSSAQVSFTGKSRTYLAQGGAWNLNLLSKEIDSDWPNRTYRDISNAEVLTTVGPTLTNRDLREDAVNVFALATDQLDLLEDRIGGGVVSFRLDGPSSGENNIFSWYSGYSPENQVFKPALTITYVVPSSGNLPPVADAGEDQTALVSSVVTLDGTGSGDPDGDPLIYEWTQRDGPEDVELMYAETATPSFTPSSVGEYIFQLRVSDGLLTDVDEVTVEVVTGSGEVEEEYPLVSLGNDSTATASRNYPYARLFALGVSSRSPYRNFARWQIDIPAGTRVISAYLRVKAKETTTTVKTVNINLLDEDSCRDFLSDNPWYRAVAGETVTWHLSGEWRDGEWYESPDLAALIQDFLDRPAYSPGNYIGLMIDEGDPDSVGYRIVDSFAGSGGTGGFVLVVIYTQPHP
jgi:subtilisin